MTDRDLAGLAPNGRLRAAINLGNRALAREEDGRLTGVSPALARRLADEIGVPLDPVVYHGAGKVFADARSGVWDVAFLAIDATRGGTVAFTRPYKTIEATYVVRADDPLDRIEAADSPGRTILVGRGSAYDLYLTEALSHATLIRAETPGASFDRFRAGEGDIVAGVRESLEGAFGHESGYRVLPGRITAIEQAMVRPDHDPVLRAALDQFVARAIADGYVAAELDAMG